MIALNEFAGGPSTSEKIPHEIQLKKAFVELLNNQIFYCWKCQKKVTPRIRDNVLYCPCCDESGTLSIKLKSD